jgi:hypothetical protein
MTVRVTHHAIDRYIERVAPTDRISARDAMLAAERGIETAARIGCRLVRLPNGARLVIRGVREVRVVTVLGRRQHVASAPLSRPVCCGSCGLRCSHPVARACTRAGCPLAHHRRAQQ